MKRRFFLTDDQTLLAVIEGDDTNGMRVFHNHPAGLKEPSSIFTSLGGY